MEYYRIGLSHMSLYMLAGDGISFPRMILLPVQNMDFTETGYTFGVELMYPLGSLSHGFYFRGGGIYNQVRVESSSGGITADSGHGLGWQAETGLAFDLGYNWVFKPGIRYRSLSEDIQVGNMSSDINLSYINFAIGISRSF